MIGKPRLLLHDVGCILQRYASDLLALLVMLVVGWNVTFGIESIIDIKLADESSSLFSGVSLLSEGFPHPEYSPLYAVWYFFLSLLQPDRVELYYLNYKLLTVLPAVLLYVLLRIRKVSLLIAFCCACLFILCEANLPVWPKVGHFALCLITTVMIVFSLVRTRMTKVVVLTTGMLLVAFSRPEFFVAYMLVVFIAVILIVGEVRQRRIREAIPAVLVILVISVILIGILGVPTSGNRGFIAFKAHFAINWINWTGSSLSPWLDAHELFAEAFGPAESFMEAVRAKPLLILRHVMANVTAAPVRMVQMFCMPARHFSGVFLLSRIVAPYWLLMLLVLALVLQGISVSRMRENLRQHKWFLVGLAPFLFPPFMSSVLMFAKNHYILMLTVPAIIACLSVFAPAEESTQRSDLRGIVLIGLCLVLSVPATAVSRNRPTARTIRFLEAAGIQERVNLLEAEQGYHFYLSSNYNRIKHVWKKGDFDSFRKEHEVNAIVVTQNLMEDRRYRTDASWKAFLSDYGAAGFVKLRVPETDNCIIIARDLLKSSAATVTSIPPQ